MSELIFRAVIQRVSHAEVLISGQSQGRIDQGLVILFAVGIQTELSYFSLEKFKPTLEKMADKILNLRIFQDDQDKMNLSVKDVSGGIYLISQFTLFADCKKGNRPSFIQSAKPDVAKLLYDLFLDILKTRSENLTVFQGVFGADMKVHLCNEGPVTILMDF